MRKLSTNKIEKGTATILESERLDFHDRQIVGPLGLARVSWHETSVLFLKVEWAYQELSDNFSFIDLQIRLLCLVCQTML